MCCQVVVSDVESPLKFSCQLTSSQLALELLQNNLNDYYTTTSQHRRRLRYNSDDEEADVTNTEYIDTSQLYSRQTDNLERPLGVHQGELQTGNIGRIYIIIGSCKRHGNAALL